MTRESAEYLGTFRTVADAERAASRWAFRRKWEDRIMWGSPLVIVGACVVGALIAMVTR